MDTGIDWNFAGHQVVTHLVEGPRPNAASNPVDGHDVPVPHFGLVLSVPDFHRLADRLRRAGAAFVIEPYVRNHAAELAPGLEPDWLPRNDVQIDAPYGDVPADLTSQNAGSAGLAIAAALVSLMSGRLVRTEVAVTGGLTAAGELLPVRGFRERARCAKRGYAKLPVAPKANEADVHRVSQQDRRDLRLVFAATSAEALHAALARHPVSGQSHAS